MKRSHTDPADLTHPIYKNILKLLFEHRFATTHQLARLTRPEYRSTRSAMRQTLRHVRTLREAGLVMALERRIGGWQGGSAVSIWALTTSGHGHLTGSHKRTRPEHLSTGFLEHGLAVTETRVLIEEATRALPRTEMTVQHEPKCWRQYLDPHGITVTLKPDLQLRVTSADYQDLYFLEVDRATENPGRVMRKCWQYEQYRRTGTEQRQHGVFPAVIWLVPSEHRKSQLLRYLHEERKLSHGVFTVITPNELFALIRDGPTTNS